MATRPLDLTEWHRSEPIALSVDERDALAGILPSITVQPEQGENAKYTLTPGSTVGAVDIGDFSVVIRPKIGIPQLLSLACYAIGNIRFQREDFGYSEDVAFPDVLALALAAHARRAFAAGLLHGYRTEEEALYGVRGRIRFDDQLKRRFGVAMPVEVRYDEFTDDILANRLVKAAVTLLGGMRLRWRDARVGLGWVAAMLNNVSLVEFPASVVPEVSFDRLNDHYKRVVALSRLVLQNSAFQGSRGGVRAQGFLMDMNQVFQEFVTVALREELELSPATFGERSISSLDVSGSIHLRPDLVWSHGQSCVFVGDAKYKNLTDRDVPEGDLYQLLAYVTALDLPGGMLIYAAEGETRRGRYIVRHSEKTLEVETLDVSGNLDEVLGRVGRVAARVRHLRAIQGHGLRPSWELPMAL